MEYYINDCILSGLVEKLEHTRMLLAELVILSCSNVRNTWFVIHKKKKAVFRIQLKSLLWISNLKSDGEMGK